MQGGVINNTNPHGAGTYGAPEQTHKTRCPHSNNPFGHSRECACKWWEETRMTSEVSGDDV